MRERRGMGIKRMLWIIGIALLLVVVALKAISFTGSPPARPPELVELPGCPVSPNCVCSQNADEKHRVEPISIQGDLLTSWRTLVGVIEGEGGTPVDVQENRYARFEFRSWLFGFVDDVELLVDESAKQIEVRSASRSGYSDFGVNRRRVEVIRRSFDEAVRRQVAGMKR